MPVSAGVPGRGDLLRYMHYAVGEARARGAVGREDLLAAATLAVRTAYGDGLDEEITRGRLVDLAGGPDAAIWSAPNPLPDDLPDGLEALVTWAWRHHHALLFAEEVPVGGDPWTIWPAVVAALCARGGPDPRPFWLANALEDAAGRPRLFRWARVAEGGPSLGERAREEARLAGTPIYYTIHGRGIVKEWPDGRVEDVDPD